MMMLAFVLLLNTCCHGLFYFGRSTLVGAFRVDFVSSCFRNGCRAGFKLPCDKKLICALVQTQDILNVVVCIQIIDRLKEVGVLVEIVLLIRCG